MLKHPFTKILLKKTEFVDISKIILKRNKSF